jgi:membrane protease YdiL (CAAX protease family)
VASTPDTALAQAPPPDAAEPADPATDGFPRWPVWAPFLAVLVGATASIVIVGVVIAFAQSVDSKLDDDSPWFTAISTIGLDGCVVAAIAGVAAMTARPRLWHFGLRPTALRHAIGIAFMAVVAFLAFELLYSAAVHPEQQRIVEELGADQSTALLVTGGLAVIVVAPIAEELLFRGFLFRVLRMRMGFWLAALIDGVLFGLVHGSLVIVPVLAFLGVALCWVYERTGSLFPCIAIHVLNNTVAYGGTTDNGWVVAGALGGAMLAACILVPTALGRARAAPA